MATAALALGSNLGDRARALASARALLEAGGFLGVTAASRVYQTEPVGGPPQPHFLNQVLLATTGLAPEALLELAMGVEALLGRERAVPLGPRTLDVDLLFVGDALRRTPALTLPHPSLHLRRFVLVPLCDVAPRWRHPALGKTAEELLEACGDSSRVELWGGTVTSNVKR